MLFHFRLLGRDRMALFSFIHSLNTTSGISIFEPVAETLASKRFKSVSTQVEPFNEISMDAQIEIQRIMDALVAGNVQPDKNSEIERIRRVAQRGHKVRTKTVRIDLAVVGVDNSVHLFDIKTAKPNISSFRDHKRTLLEWIAIFWAQDNHMDIHSYIAIPYNLYEPRPYERWTLRGMLDIEEELKVASEFWDFLGGDGAYDDVLVCFERAGFALRSEIDEYFRQFL